MIDEVLNPWLNTVWQKRKNLIFKPEALLIMDLMRAHRKGNMKSACKAIGANLTITSGGLTETLQPLEVGINYLVKAKVRKHWEKQIYKNIPIYM